MTVDKGQPEQEQIAQPGCSCAGGLWFPHPHLLVGCYFILAETSFFSDWALTV